MFTVSVLSILDTIEANFTEDGNNLVCSSCICAISHRIMIGNKVSTVEI